MPPKRQSPSQRTSGPKKRAGGQRTQGNQRPNTRPKRANTPSDRRNTRTASRDTSDTGDSSTAEPDKVRLQRFLASTGLGSRRNCEEFILAGRVTVDGVEVRDLATTVDPGTQKITVDGETARMQKRRYYILNKPKGYLCTNNDPSGRKRAVDLIRDNERLFTVGRLDENSQGLILVTNDGELGNRLAHPRYKISRTYRVHVAGVPTLETLGELKKGLYFPDGKFHVTGVKRVKIRGKSAILEMQLHQGRNREIRRLLARVGHKVMSLERISFGPLHLRGLGVGKSRELKARELQDIKDLLSNPPDADAESDGESDVQFDQPHRRQFSGVRKKKARRVAPQTSASRSTGPKTAGSRNTKPKTGGRSQARGKKVAKKRPATRSKTTSKFGPSKTKARRKK